MSENKSIKKLLDELETSYFSSFIESSSILIKNLYDFITLYIQSKFAVHDKNNQTLKSNKNILTNYEKVAEFNDAFGNNKIENLTSDTFTQEPKLIELLVSLITEECKELQDAVKYKDPIETRDALADILYVVYGMQYRLGIDGNEDFDIVHNSNMSKLCNNEEEAIVTVDNYKEKYKAGSSPYDSPYYEKLKNKNKWVIKNKSTGKVLKNINYKKVKFE
tara:strand:+ start:878 stop:1537 length:660 start_codon:yes stop_codon:yes gene_type:complete